MIWGIPNFAAASPIEAILDKENFTLEELLDEDDIIQECKALNARLINFLRERVQVEQLVRYVVEDAPEDAESKRAFKFPFIACEIFTCEIDFILRNLVEDEEMMNMLFSFLEPSHSHSSLLAGCFSKVVTCLMLRKTTSLMNYVQSRKRIFQQLVDLIGITSVMEILIRLVGGDDHAYPNFLDVMQWLSESDLLELVVDKLNPISSPVVHANAAEVLSAILRSAPSSLAVELTSPRFVTKIFSYALEDSLSKSALFHCLSVCIYLLDPRRTNSTSLVYPVRSQHLCDLHIAVDPEIIEAMLPKLGDLFRLLDITSDANALPTTYGELRPPLGKHRLKIVEFFTVLLGIDDAASGNELIRLGAIQRILHLFFEYPFNNSLHHHVECIVYSCLESKNTSIVDHLFRDCDIISRFLQADKNPIVSSATSPSTCLISSRQGPRAGNIGHITRIANKLVNMRTKNGYIQAFLQDSEGWAHWQSVVLQERNAVENIYSWACGHPSASHQRTKAEEDEELRDREYDVSPLPSNISETFRYCTYENDVKEDVYFDDDSAVVISSLRLEDGSESSPFTNCNWFNFQDEKISENPLCTSTSNQTDDTGCCNEDDGEIVVGEDCESEENGALNVQSSEEKASCSNDMETFDVDTRRNGDLFDEQQLPEWVGWREPCDILVDESSSNSPQFLDTEAVTGTAYEKLEGAGRIISSFFEDAEFVGAELEETGRALHFGLKGPVTCEIAKSCQDGSLLMEFNEKNTWLVEPEVGVVQE